MQPDDTTPRYPSIRVNLLHAHGTCICYNKGCRCTSCRAAMAERQRVYTARHREERLAYCHRYSKEHPDEIRARNATYRAENRDKVLEWRRRYRSDHPERVAEWNRRFRESHREERADRQRLRKAARCNAPGTHTVADVRAQYKRQKGRCFWCHEKVGDAYHVDHVVPLVLGGSDGPENLVVACPCCNLRKSAKHPQEFAGILC